jgi:hypothetical protein
VSSKKAVSAARVDGAGTASAAARKPRVSALHPAAAFLAQTLKGLSEILQRPLAAECSPKSGCLLTCGDPPDSRRSAMRKIKQLAGLVLAFAFASLPSCASMGGGGMKYLVDPTDAATYTAQMLQI